MFFCSNRLDKGGEFLLLSEKWLVKRAQKGDGEAFVKLIEQYENVLYGIAKRYLGIEDAADVLQDTILIAFEEIGNLKQPQYFHTWITKILINQSYNLIKKNNKFSYNYSDNHQKLLVEDCEEGLELENLISKLDPVYRVPILLYYYSGFSYKEISIILGEPLGTVKSRIFRGKAWLKKEYTKGD